MQVLKFKFKPSFGQAFKNTRQQLTVVEVESFLCFGTPKSHRVDGVIHISGYGDIIGHGIHGVGIHPFVVVAFVVRLQAAIEMDRQ